MPIIVNPSKIWNEVTLPNDAPQNHTNSPIYTSNITNTTLKYTTLQIYKKIIQSTKNKRRWNNNRRHNKIYNIQ